MLIKVRADYQNHDAIIASLNERTEIQCDVVENNDYNNIGIYNTNGIHIRNGVEYLEVLNVPEGFSDERSFVCIDTSAAHVHLLK